MQRVTDATIDYLAQQIEVGADVVMLFDSWSGVLPAAQFRRYVIEPTRQIAAALKQRFPETPVIGFPRLAGSMLGEYAATGVQGVGVDTAADPAHAAALVPGHIALQGNVDPLALLAGGDALAQAARTVLDAWRGPAVHLQSRPRRRAADAAGACGRPCTAGPRCLTRLRGPPPLNHEENPPGRRPVQPRWTG